ncbi:MAG: hypothetical protein H0X51_06685 [Parachlamydiaceae bacterium]|nr:hypothetical protein [Parachlamydiaceae bacterium]
MHITIAERLKPFSHEPGIQFILPGSCLRFTCYPALLRVHDLSQTPPKLLTDVTLNVTGPLTDFTVQQDLEKARIYIWGHSPKGFLRYAIHAVADAPKQFLIKIEKKPEDFGMSYPNETADPYSPKPTERLSLGSHKNQDWTLLQRHNDMHAILPLWFRLGQLTPHFQNQTCEGSLHLLKECQQLINTHNTTALVPALTLLLQAGFEPGLSPRLSDESNLGLRLPPVTSQASPLILLSEGAALIRSCFIATHSNHISILPALPPEFHCGRLIQVHLPNLGILDMEWSKKLIRRIHFQALTTANVSFQFQKDITRFRLNGCFVETIQRSAHLPIEKGNSYFFDRF